MCGMRLTTTLMTIKITAKDIGDVEATYYVIKVIQGGRVSKSRHGDAYCFVTTFKNGVVVVADRTKTLDTFRVYRTT